MPQVILDVTTRGLKEAIHNVQHATDLITAGTARAMQQWYNSHFKKTALQIVESGEGMAANAPKYAQWKRNHYGIDHPLGVMTGGLYMAIVSSQPITKETRGKEVRLHVKYDHPYYVAYVIDGRANQPARDFVTVARDKELPQLTASLGRMFDGLDFTEPYPKLMSSVLGASVAPSLADVGFR